MCDLQKDIKPRESWSIAYYRGALDAAFRECVEIEHALGLQNGAHINLYYRLEQWRTLLEQLAADNKAKEREKGNA